MKQQTILITGATGAIGNSLARYYAKAEVLLILQGRNSEVLQELKTQCESRGATVQTVIMDLRDSQLVRNWALQLIENNLLPDLIIANAGVNTHAPRKGEGEIWQEVENLLDINIKSTIALINALIPALQKRGSGQIALMSSLAAYYGLPVTPSYCASKAAIKAYGEAIRGALAPYNIKVTVIMPGYIQSDMSKSMPSPKLFIWTAEKAAQVIAKELQKNPARLSFPFPLNLGTWLLTVMPASISQYFVKLLGYWR